MLDLSSLCHRLCGIAIYVCCHYVDEEISAADAKETFFGAR